MATLHEDRRVCMIFVEFFLKLETFQAWVVEKFKTHFMFSDFFFRKSCCLWDNMEKYVEPDRPQMAM